MVLGSCRVNIIWKVVRNDPGVILELLEIDPEPFLSGPIADALANFFGFQISAEDSSHGAEIQVSSNKDAQVDHVVTLLAARMDRSPASAKMVDRLEEAVKSLHTRLVYLLCVLYFTWKTQNRSRILISEFVHSCLKVKYSVLVLDS